MHPKVEAALFEILDSHNLVAVDFQKRRKYMEMDEKYRLHLAAVDMVNLTSMLTQSDIADFLGIHLRTFIKYYHNEINAEKED